MRRILGLVVALWLVALSLMMAGARADEGSEQFWLWAAVAGGLAGAIGWAEIHFGSNDG